MSLLPRWKSLPSTDPLLKQFFAARTDREANLCLDKLWMDTLQAVAARSLAYKRLTREQRDNLLADVGSKLAQHLHERRGEKRDDLTNVVAYTRTITAHLFVDFVREQRPGWRHLCQCIKAAIEEHDTLVSREGNTDVGLRAWKRKPDTPNAKAIHFLAGEYDDFRRQALHNQTPREIAGRNLAHLHQLIEAVLLWVEMPLSVNHLAYHLMLLLEMEPAATVSLEERQETTGMDIVDPIDMTEHILGRMAANNLLARFGRFVIEGDLNLCERGGVTLIQTRADLIDHLQILVTELASSLGFPASSPERHAFFMQQIWPALPLTSDTRIADVLGIEDKPRTPRQMLISNGRRTAITRKWPAWLTRNGWKEEAESFKRKTSSAAR